MSSENYLNKYLKYKKKYLDLKTEYMKEGGDFLSETKQILKSLGEFKNEELTDSDFYDEEKREIKNIFKENFKLFIDGKKSITAKDISYVLRGTLPQTFKATKKYIEGNEKLNQENNYVKFVNIDNSVIYYYDLQSKFIHKLESLKEVNDEDKNQIQDYQLSSGNGTGDNGYYLQSIEKVDGNFNDFNSKQENFSRVTKIIDNIKARKTKESK